MNEAPVHVGDIYCMSWGYDQTNVNYFQVVSLTAKGFRIREIDHKHVPGTEGFMCAQVTPVPGQFKSSSQWVKDQAGEGVLIRRQAASFTIAGRYYVKRVAANSQTYCSWYA